MLTLAEVEPPKQRWEVCDEVVYLLTTVVHATQEVKTTFNYHIKPLWQSEKHISLGTGPESKVQVDTSCQIAIIVL